MSFVCDAMLGRTARFLRLFGYDTLYDNSYDDPELIEIAREENRVLLTRDVELYQRASKLNVQSYLLLEKTYLDRITSLCLKMDLKLELNPNNSRCATCNAKIIQISKEEVKGKVPIGTFSVFDEFWICSNENCGKVYYQGPHWVNITSAFEQIMKKMKSKKDK